MERNHFIAGNVKSNRAGIEITSWNVILHAVPPAIASHILRKVRREYDVLIVKGKLQLCFGSDLRGQMPQCFIVLPEGAEISFVVDGRNSPRVNRDDSLKPGFLYLHAGAHHALNYSWVGTIQSHDHQYPR